PTARGSTRRTAGGCCAPPTPRTCSSRVPRRRTRPGSTGSSPRSTRSLPCRASSAGRRRRTDAPPRPRAADLLHLLGGARGRGERVRQYVGGACGRARPAARADADERLHPDPLRGREAGAADPLGDPGDRRAALRDLAQKLTRQRHCEERSDAAIQTGLLRYARNDVFLVVLVLIAD